jgi:hypothetical protein
MTKPSDLPESQFAIPPFSDEEIGARCLAPPDDIKRFMPVALADERARLFATIAAKDDAILRLKAEVARQQTILDRHYAKPVR